MQRVLIVSNRLPTSIVKRKGVLNYHRSAGGLATGLSSLSYEGNWIGWPGYSTNNEEEKEQISERLSFDNMHPIFLSKEDVEKYYEGFSNNTIWPLFHYFAQYTVYNQAFWDAYEKVNSLFCEEVLKITEPNDIIWINDYHLMLLPGMIREKLTEATIGFFLHIPFPSFEIFRFLPWRDEILQGLLGADLVGFHTFDYVRHFHSAVTRLIRIEHTFGKLTYGDRLIQVDSFPMGIDFRKYAEATQKSAVKKEITKTKKKIGKRKIILSIDRLDYSKGIMQRLEAFHLFLHKNPEYREKVTLIMVVVPSRSKVETYKRLKHQLDELVGRINGEDGTIGWTPIWYLYRSFPFNSLSALYAISDIALVTPFRDGMNLIAKEFVANKRDGKGVLILSEMAGSADELGEAIIVNPNNIPEIADALKEAINMPEEEQIRRNKEMQEKLKRYNISRWAEDFIERLLQTKDLQQGMLTKHLNHRMKQNVIDKYKKSEHRLILLDYDGTLVPFAETPDKAKPDIELLKDLKNVTHSSQNEVVIISGRDKATLEEWFKKINIGLVAEHGAWLREKGHPWEIIEPMNQEWKEEIRPILELYMDRTPGSLIEEKEFSLVWHYRKADVGLGETRSRELLDTLIYLTSNLDLQVLEGSKVIEVKNIGINKGRAASRWISKRDWDFILAIGDDWTDEDLFKVLPSDAYSIKVGFISSVATHNLRSYKEVRSLLKELMERNTNEKTH